MNALQGSDFCVSIFGSVYATGALVFPPQATVLEIGHAEADWMTPMLQERPDLQITGIDWRPELNRPGRVIQGDVLTYDFPAGSFDVVVGISSIEHIGLGHYHQDPLDPDGDTHALARAVSWLKPGGWIYADVPFDPSGYRLHGTEYRAYDAATLRQRLIVPGLTLRQCWYCYMGQWDRLHDTAPTEPGFSCVAFLAVKG